MSWPYWIVIALAWALVGLAAAAYLHRRGHRDRTWFLVGSLLGPLFVPIAAERTRGATRTLERHGGPGSAADDTARGVAVLVGVDGSAESDQAVRDAGRLVAAGARRVLLVAVLDADSAEHGGEEARRQARRLLADRAGWLPGDGATVATAVAAGPPARALLDLADTEDVDVLVVGRRGTGVSRAVIGSVAEHITAHATRPVLLAAPPPGRR